ncbi:MAG: hypothetical protein ABIA59_04405 [Candidatus Latescibacterota bacterium]
MKHSPRVCGILLLFVIEFMIPFVVQAASTRPGTIGDYRESLVFFELFYNDYADSSNVILMPNHQLHISPFGTQSIADFTWQNDRITNYSLWLRLENLEYLLPLIGSADAVLETTARLWFESWCRAHRGYAQPNRAAWDPMTAATRAMVLVYYLKVEEARTGGRRDVIDLLLSEIKSHQQFLSAKERFSFNSNHGLREAIGLLETTRAYADSGCARGVF